jgi:tRNA U38,U39,U40 pseudouridine synthase TruA
LHKAGFLATDNYTELQRKHKYSRAARTDKGVHAVVNGISCEFYIDKNYFNEDSTLNKEKLHLDLKEAFE